MRAIQVKATKIEEDGYQIRVGRSATPLSRSRHRQLEGDENTLHLDESRVFLIAKDDVRNGLVERQNFNGMLSMEKRLTGYSRARKRNGGSNVRRSDSLAYKTG